MPSAAATAPNSFDPSSFSRLRFLQREIDSDGLVTLGYSLDERISFVERIELPVDGQLSGEQLAGVQGLLSMLHWAAGVSYYKTAAPAAVEFTGDAPPPAAAGWLEALYREGLGEFAYTNALPAPPAPRFSGGAPEPAAEQQPVRERTWPRRVLVPVGGGKDSAVAIEIVRGAGAQLSLFSVGDAAPISRTVEVAGLPRLLARRTLDPQVAQLNGAGALNGHVPITAIVSCIALIVAQLGGFEAVALANERSASAGNLFWQGIEVNHQFSKGLRAERLLAAAAAEAGGPVPFSVLRPASELAIARAFARLERYHGAFTSCNAIFRLDPSLRAASWCRDCPKCRFVFLVLAPFSEPEHLREIFGADLLADPAQADGFALLTATGGHKPFECVGEEQESVAAIRMLAEDPRWSSHAVVRELAGGVLAALPPHFGDPARVLALSGEHDVPDSLMGEVRALLGA